MSQNVGVFTRSLLSVCLLTAVAVIIVAPAVASAQAATEVLHFFDLPVLGRYLDEPPSASVTWTADGDLYVTTAGGGSFEGRVVDQGTIFKMTPAGVITMLHEFSGGADGATPYGALLQVVDGTFYGTTARGGAYGLGTVFSVQTDGRLSTLHSFAGGSDGARPMAAIIQAADGNFYGTTMLGGVDDSGTIYRMAPNGSVSILYSFTDSFGIGSHPQAPLLQASDGEFYGTTSYAQGSIFKMTPGGSVTAVGGPGTYDSMYGPVVQGLDGTMYVTTILSTRARVLRSRIVAGFGRLWMDLVTLEDSGPIGALAAAPDGALYGTTSRGGAFNHGTVFKVSPAGVLTTLYSIPGVNARAWGDFRAIALARAADGTLYATVSGDGRTEIGSVVRLTPDGAARMLNSFVGGRDLFGAFSFQGADGNFYGRTIDGGRFGQGSMFRMTPAGSYSVVHEFGGGAAEGVVPEVLVPGADGVVYGTTDAGGAFGYGSVFRLAADGTATVLHAFTGGADGARGGWLVDGKDGYLYGTTRRGGLFDGGTVFRIGSDGTTTILHAFPNWSPSSFLGGDDPHPSSFVLGADGNFYGTIASGCVGEVFRLTPAGGFTTLFSIGLTDGDYYCLPLPGIARGQDGNIYGTTLSTFKGARGSFYRVNYNGTVTIIRSFYAFDWGVPYPTGMLTAASDGGFYGFFEGEPADSTGSVYSIGKIAVDGSITILRDNGGRSLIEGSDGYLYAAYYQSPPLAPVDRTVLSRIRVRPATHRDGDVDGDGKADMMFFRPSDGTWQTRNTRTGATSAVQWGNSLDVPVPGDYDGDGKTDLAVFRPSDGTWYIRYTGTDHAAAVQWGNGLDVPVPGDYDGDGVTDIAVFRPYNGVWYLRYSSTGTTAGFQWGNALDLVVPRDYDGDGTTDIAVFRPSNGTWYVRYTRTGMTAGFQWGNGFDIPVAADYDGDGIADIAVFRPSNGTWYVWASHAGTPFGVQWGNGADVPVPADYNGDGKTDVAVYRPSANTWYVWYSSTAAEGFVWGTSGDRPVLQRR